MLVPRFQPAMGDHPPVIHSRQINPDAAAKPRVPGVENFSGFGTMGVRLMACTIGAVRIRASITGRPMRCSMTGSACRWRPEHGLPTGPLASRLRGAGGGPVDNPAPAVHHLRTAISCPNKRSHLSLVAYVTSKDGIFALVKNSAWHVKGFTSETPAPPRHC
jgi:hypothetical protein